MNTDLLLYLITGIVISIPVILFVVNRFFGELTYRFTIWIVIVAAICAVGGFLIAAFGTVLHMVIIFAIAITAILVVIRFFYMKIVEPITIMKGAIRSLGFQGNLNREIPEEIKKKIMSIRGELGEMAQGLKNTEMRLQYLTDTAMRIAAGDLTAEIHILSESDELGTAIEKMVDSLKDSIHQIATSAAQLSCTSALLSTTASQSGQAAGQIATAIQQVASGASQQNESVTRTARYVDQMSHAITGVANGAQEQAAAVQAASSATTRLSDAIQQISNSAQKLAENAAGSVQVAKDSASVVEQTIQGMQSIQGKVKLSSQKVQEMGQRSDQIGAIVQTIDDISSQTNLLALNAAIEAARAGEHGKGFAVVADEVRKLAEKSTIATKEIAALIHAIQQTVTDAVTAMQESGSEVEKGVSYANQSSESLEKLLKTSQVGLEGGQEIARATGKMGTLSGDLVTAMDRVSAVVEQNTAATKEMSTGSGEVSQAIESIASVSEENSAAVEEVSAGAEEMSAQMNDVIDSTKSLAQMANELNQLVEKFKLSH